MSKPKAKQARITRTQIEAGYKAALRSYLHSAQQGGGRKATLIGHLAGRHGLDATDLAAVHKQAMVGVIDGPFINQGIGFLNRAGDFLAQALAPIAASRRAAQQAARHLQRHNKTLSAHAGALARANQRLQREIARRKAGELAIKNAREHYKTLFLDAKVMQKKLRNVTRQILSAQEEERKAISRALHDEVTQTLVGINVELSTLGKRAAYGTRWKQAVIARTQKLVAKSINEVHRFARELRPAVLDDLGLIPALHGYARALATRKKLAIQLTAFAEVETLGEKEKTMLYRVAQEALSNVARHAEASEVSVNLVEIDGRVRLEVIDNGKSFAVERALNSRNPRRLGLVGMKERVAMFGGTFEIQSHTGRGTHLRAEIPFSKKHSP